MTVRFLDIAEAELDDAIHWYQAQAPGLGDAFLLEVMTAANRITRYPQAWHLLEEGIRRCRLTRFPYGLIYAVEKDDIVVLAVAHFAPQARLLARAPSAEKVILVSVN